MQINSYFVHSSWSIKVRPMNIADPDPGVLVGSGSGFQNEVGSGAGFKP